MTPAYPLGEVGRIAVNYNYPVECRYPEAKAFRRCRHMRSLAFHMFAQLLWPRLTYVDLNLSSLPALDSGLVDSKMTAFVLDPKRIATYTVPNPAIFSVGTLFYSDSLVQRVRDHSFAGKMRDFISPVDGLCWIFLCGLKFSLSTALHLTPISGPSHVLEAVDLLGTWIYALGRFIYAGNLKVEQMTKLIERPPFSTVQELTTLLGARKAHLKFFSRVVYMYKKLRVAESGFMAQLREAADGDIRFSDKSRGWSMCTDVMRDPGAVLLSSREAMSYECCDPSCVREARSLRPLLPNYWVGFFLRPNLSWPGAERARLFSTALPGIMDNLIARLRFTASHRTLSKQFSFLSQ